MANIFAITTATEETAADAGGKAVVTFTVTNTLEKPVRGTARARALENTQQGWLEVEGEMERDFSAKGTQVYAVNFRKPATAAGEPPPPPEKFPFRLDVFSSANPDEEFTEGPAVRVEVSKTAVYTKKAFPWWIIILVAGLLLVIVLLLFLVLRRDGGGEKIADNRKPDIPVVVQANNARFEGGWQLQNPDHTKANVFQGIDIKQDGNTIYVYFNCGFISCDPWGTGKGEISGDTAKVEWNQEGNTGHAVITQIKPGLIQVEGQLDQANGFAHPAVKDVFERR